MRIVYNTSAPIYKFVTEEIGYWPHQNLVLHCSLLLLQMAISSTGGSTLLQYLSTAFSVSVIIRSVTDGSFSQNYRPMLIYYSHNYILNVHYLRVRSSALAPPFHCNNAC